MAPQILFKSPSHSASLSGRSSCLSLIRYLVLIIGLFLCSLPARAQLQQPFVFAPDAANPNSIDVYTRNDLTGVLTPVPGSPFPSRQTVNVMSLDFKGRFLFTASYNPSKISMFTIDPNTGALQEVPNSPFASPSTNDPVFLSTESSGQTLYVINFNSSQVDISSLESFQIDPGNLGLVPSPSGATLLPALFLTGATHPSGKTFYAFLTIPNVPTIPNEAVFLVFDSSTGTFNAPSLPTLGPYSSTGIFRCCFALDPQGQRLALSINGLQIIYALNSDGTLSTSSIVNSISGATEFMSFDPLGQFLYMDTPISPTSDLVHFISTATLLESSNSPLPSGFPVPSTWSVDPTAPLIFASQVYQVDPLTGVPTSILAPTPINSPNDGVPIAVFSRPPGSQPILGPIAVLSTPSLSFGSLSVGQTTGPQTLTLLSNGGQALSLNTIAITGANPGDFAITSDACHEPTSLPPGQSCSVLLSFTPSAAGSRTAALTITDNASPPVESAQLNGMGLNPAPAVSLLPGSLDFGNVTQGTNASLPVSVKNSGTAPLHISSVVIAGVNANDFSSSSTTCNAALPANSACTINVTFTPLAAGLRTATVTLTDDAPDSPQVINVQGNATAAPASGVLVNPSSPDFGAATQGTSTPLNVTVTNSGTAALHISNAVLGGANASEFSFSDPTCAAAIPAAGTCTIALMFTPVSVGAHAATLTLSDDAPGSPHTINIKGTANPAVTAAAAQGSSTTASVSAGQTAQFQLQLTPGAGFSGAVSLTCSGAPLGAVCQVPSSVTITNGAPAPFTVAVSTAGTGALPPSKPLRFNPPAPTYLLQLVVVALLLLVLVGRNRMTLNNAFRLRRLASIGAFTVLLAWSAIYASGCGSTSAVMTTPPPIVTPPGISTIIITMTAMSPTQQPLQLPPIQLTLTVK